MGCGHSTPVSKRNSQSQLQNERFDTPVPQDNGFALFGATDEGLSKERKKSLGITTESMMIVQRSWETVSEDTNIGEEIFDVMINASYDTKELFESRQVSIASLGQRFTKSFKICIITIGEAIKVPSKKRSKFLQPIIDIGKRHAKYNISEYHYNILWQAIQTTLARSLGDSLDGETKQAWRFFYAYLCRTLVTVHRREIKKELPGVPEIQKKVIKLTQDDVAYIKSTWNSVTIERTILEQSYYLRLFQRAAQLRDLYADVDGDFTACGFLLQLNDIVEKLPDIQAVRSSLGDAGIRHAFYGVRECNYITAGQALIDVLPTVRPSSGLAKSWSQLFEIIAQTMSADPDLGDGSETSSEFPDPEKAAADIDKSIVFDENKNLDTIESQSQPADQKDESFYDKSESYTNGDYN